MLGTVDGNIKAQRGVLSRGPEGIDQTVHAMMKCAMGEYGMRSPKIRALSLNVIREAGVPQKDYYGQIVAIHNWVRDNIYYLRDVVNQETISQPEETAFNSKAEDCDGQSTLEIAMLGSVGIRAVPVVIGMQPNRFSHVYLMAVVPAGKGRNAGKQIMLDPIMTEWKAGREAPANKVKAKKIYTQYLRAINAEDVPMNSGDRVPLSISDVAESMGAFGALGAYAEADSYLDYNDEEAVKALLGDKDGFPTGRDWIDERNPSVTITSTVDAPAFGMDGMMGMGLGDDESDYNQGQVSYNTVLKSVTPAPIRGPYGTGPLGPLYSANARAQTHYLTQTKAKRLGTAAHAIPLGRPDRPVNPVVDVMRRDPISGNAKIVGVRKSKFMPNQAIVLNENSDYECAVAASTAPKTNFQEAAEVEGLDGYLSDIDSGFALAGLGNEGSESDPLDDAAIAAWVARYKACKTAAAAKIAEGKLKIAVKAGAPAQVKAIVNDDAKNKRQIAKRAAKVAKKAVKVEHKLIGGRINRAAQAKAIQEVLDESNHGTDGALGEYLAGGDNADDLAAFTTLDTAKKKAVTGINKVIANLMTRIKRLTPRSDIGSETAKARMKQAVNALDVKRTRILTTPASRENAVLKWKKLREQKHKLAARIDEIKQNIKRDPNARAKIARKTRHHVQNAATQGTVDGGISGIDLKSPKVYIPAALIAAYLVTR